MMQAASWRALSPNARAAYLEVYFGYDGENNGRILLSALMLADRLGRDKSTAARALKELEQHGFIQCVSKGGFNCKAPHASEWRMTAFNCNVTGELASKSFMRWQPKNSECGGTGESHGGTCATDSLKATRNSPSQWHRCDRESHFKGVGGGTGATPLYSNHIGSDTTAATAGAATSEASAMPSVNRVLSEPETFTDIHGAALKSLAELSERLAPDVQSWAARKLAPSKPADPARAA
jgi:hypothetical protein